MYIEKVKLYNFRKFSNLEIGLNKWLNLFLWPNDSWKTAIIDALKFCLWTANYWQNKLTELDFYNSSKSLKIELFITDFTDSQASKLLDWGWFNDENNFSIKLIYEARIWLDNQIYVYGTKAWTYESDDWGSYLEPEAKKMFESVYLKPLRNAEIELSSGYGSRLSQILLSHPLFEKTDLTSPHELETYFKVLKETIEKYFNEEKEDKLWLKHNINKKINQIFDYLKEKWATEKWEIKMDNSNISSIVKNLNLLFWDFNKKPWLWTSNLLLIAAELLILEELKWEKLWCALIEEIEAHIHPQWQLRLINYLEKHSTNLQIFITSHSPNIASKVNLKNVFICRDNYIYSMTEKYTWLDEDDYNHLKRFLDVTKSNLFFAKWLIFVEWIAEALVIPQIADIIYWEKWILDSHWISIICLNWLTFDRYLKAFIRKKWNDFNIKISAITDRDWRININEKIDKKAFESKINSNSETDFLSMFNYIDSVEFEHNFEWTTKKKFSNIKKFFNVISTLEFDMWLSCLNDYLIDARCKLYISKTKTTFLSDINDTNICKKTFNLYKKIENKKWETAQELSEILEKLKPEEKEKLKNKILTDNYLKYIVEALKHVIY